MAEYDLKFTSSPLEDTGSYKLLELPPELCTLVESALESNEDCGLNIKGQSNEDAVLCTRDRTYALRTVVLSNSVLVVTAPPDGGDSEAGREVVVIRDQLNEILELAPTIPRLHTLDALLRGQQYDEDNEDEEMEGDEEVRTNTSRVYVRI